MPISINPYASANPTVDSLFGREFGVSQAEAAQALARDQIAAQRELARAQLRGQQQQQDLANLFRMQESRDRRAQVAEASRLEEKRLGIDETYKKGLLDRPGSRSTAQIDEANALSEGLASQYNAHLQSRLNTGKSLLEDQRKKEVEGLTTLGGLFDRSGKIAEINTKYDKMLKDLEDTTFSEVNAIAMQYAPSGSIGVDPLSRRFVPIKIKGGTEIGAPPAGTVSPVPFTMPNANIPTFSDLPLSQITPRGNPPPANPFEFLPPASALGQPTPTFTPPLSVAAPTTNVVRIPVGGGSLEMSAEDAAMSERQLRSVLPEQRAAVAAAIQDQLMKSGRVRFVPTNPQNLPPPFVPGYPQGYAP